MALYAKYLKPKILDDEDNMSEINENLTENHSFLGPQATLLWL
jgi:hypothetical protein